MAILTRRYTIVGQQQETNNHKPTSHVHNSTTCCRRRRGHDKQEASIPGHKTCSWQGQVLHHLLLLFCPNVVAAIFFVFVRFKRRLVAIIIGVRGGVKEAGAEAAEEKVVYASDARLKGMMLDPTKVHHLLETTFG
jgi:hypothetical protein